MNSPHPNFYQMFSISVHFLPILMKLWSIYSYFNEIFLILINFWSISSYFDPFPTQFLSNVKNFGPFSFTFHPIFPISIPPRMKARNFSTVKEKLPLEYLEIGFHFLCFIRLQPHRQVCRLRRKVGKLLIVISEIEHGIYHNAAGLKGFLLDLEGFFRDFTHYSGFFRILPIFGRNLWDFYSIWKDYLGI